MKSYQFLVAALVLAFPVFADAKTLYVNNSGSPACSDSTTYANNGSSNPWCTLGRALWGNTNRSTPVPSQAATAGDTVIVSAGTYTAPDTGLRLIVAFNPVNQGTSDSNRIIIQASGTVNLRSTGTLGGPIIGSSQRNYITWDGFTIDETTYTSLGSGEQSNIMVFDATEVNIQNCISIGRTTTLVDSNHAGIFYSDATGGRAYNNTIYNVRAPGINVAGFYTYGTNNLIIENNHIYDSSNGIFIKGHTADGTIARYNKLHDFTYWGIRLGANTSGYSNTSVYQNIIYNSDIGIFNTNTNDYSYGNKFVNNTIYNVAKGIMHGVELNETLFYNNIVSTATLASVYTESYSIDNPNVHDFQHNLYYNTPTQWRNEAGTSRNWTYWTDTWQQDRVAPQGVSGVNPLFVNAGSYDFHLQAGSPARTLGVDILDLDGDGSTTDIVPAGAYVTGNETIGIVSGTTNVLANPTNFRIIQ